MYSLSHVAVRVYLKEDGALYNAAPILSPDDAAELVAKELSELDRETVIVINLDNKGKPINYHTVSIGGINASCIDMGNVFKTAILSNANRIILLHNHPSGDVTPSKEDEQITKKMIKAGKVLDIGVLDHMVCGNGTYYSFHEQHPEWF